MDSDTRKTNARICVTAFVDDLLAQRASGAGQMTISGVRGAELIPHLQELCRRVIEAASEQPLVASATEAEIEAWRDDALRSHVNMTGEEWKDPFLVVTRDQVGRAVALMRRLAAERDAMRTELAAIRGRDAKPFDWDGVPPVEEWIAENLREREPRAGSQWTELHPDEVIADRGESRRVAGWLKDIMAESDAMRAKLAALVAAYEATENCPERVTTCCLCLHCADALRAAAKGVL